MPWLISLSSITWIETDGWGTKLSYNSMTRFLAIFFEFFSTSFCIKRGLINCSIREIGKLWFAGQIQSTTCFFCKEIVLWENSHAIHFHFAYGFSHIMMAQLRSSRNNMTGKFKNIHHTAPYKKKIVMTPLLPLFVTSEIELYVNWNIYFYSLQIRNRG